MASKLGVGTSEDLKSSHEAATTAKHKIAVLVFVQAAFKPVENAAMRAQLVLDAKANAQECRPQFIGFAKRGWGEGSTVHLEAVHVVFSSSVLKVYYPYGIGERCIKSVLNVLPPSLLVHLFAFTHF